MSDVLRDVLPDDLAPDDELGAMAKNYIIVILGRITNFADEVPLLGTLEAIMCQDDDVEIEVKVQLDEALTIVRTAKSVIERQHVRFSFIELHVGEDITRFEPASGFGFALKGSRIGQIDYRRRMCTLLLNLREVA